MKLKKCKYCGLLFSEKNFGVALTTKKKIYRRNKCRDCYRTTKKALQKKYRDWIVSYKKEHQCAVCGNNDFRTFEFHHKRSDDKTFDVASYITDGRGFNQIKKEIAKCTLLCANCHRILHYNKRHGV